MADATILIVDDSALIRQLVADAFKQKGYKVLAAADGGDALRVLSNARPDLIVADILMPVMDGWRFCEEVRRHPHTFDIPFIFLTTEHEVSKRVRGFRLGADDYLTKPFSQEELVARAERLLTRVKRVRDLEAAAELLSGHTRHLPVADLLQILSLNGKTGALRLMAQENVEGQIFFQDGRIIQASCGGVEGEKALFRMMMWPECRFVLEDLPQGVREAIRVSTSSVLMEGFTHWDELRQLGEAVPPRQARFKVRSRVAGFLEHLDLTPVERELISCVGQGMPMGAILDALAQRDLEIYRATLGLLDKGFLEPDTQQEDTQPVPRSSGSA